MGTNWGHLLPSVLFGDLGGYVIAIYFYGLVDTWLRRDLVVHGIQLLLRWAKFKKNPDTGVRDIRDGNQCFLGVVVEGCSRIGIDFCFIARKGEAREGKPQRSKLDIVRTL